MLFTVHAVQIPSGSSLSKFMLFCGGAFTYSPSLLLTVHVVEVSCLAEFKKLERLDLTFNNLLSHEAVQEFVLGGYDAEATAAYNRNLSDISTLKDPHSKDASQRLFQEERPVWYPINCNPLPKDYKQRKMEDDVVHEHDIAMVADKSSSSVLEEYAT
ncbi:hypothetical protein Hdeb2414_s0010g00339491 [Helianthus debilis subsp. tardiflorus]